MDKRNRYRNNNALAARTKKISRLAKAGTALREPPWDLLASVARLLSAHHLLGRTGRTRQPSFRRALGGLIQNIGSATHEATVLAKHHDDQFSLAVELHALREAYRDYFASMDSTPEEALKQLRDAMERAGILEPAAKKIPTLLLPDRRELKDLSGVDNYAAERLADYYDRSSRSIQDLKRLLKTGEIGPTLLVKSEGSLLDYDAEIPVRILMAIFQLDEPSAVSVYTAIQDLLKRRK